MVEKKKLRIVTIFNSIFKFRSWMDYDRIKAFTLYVFTGVKKLTIPNKVEVEDTQQAFSAAAKELHISEAVLKKRAKGLYRLSLLMVGCAFLIFIYFAYQLYMLNIKATFISLVLCVMALVLAFRYHFWYYQIREHRLGCSFEEWYRRGFLGKRS